MSSKDAKKAAPEKEDDAPKTVALDAGDLKLLQTYGIGPYTAPSRPWRAASRRR